MGLSKIPLKRNCPAKKLQEEPAIFSLAWLIISDTHEKTDNLAVLLKRYAYQVQGVLHLGDHDYDLLQFADTYALPLYTVAGNCDDESLSPRERVVTLGGHRVFMAHGDRYNVGMGTNRILQRARAQEAVVCLYGHTHISACEETDGILLMNPGSLTEPRDDNPPAYGLLTLDADTQTFSGRIMHV